jgi:hypothetical protein
MKQTQGDYLGKAPDTLLEKALPPSGSGDSNGNWRIVEVVEREAA